jgi:hypothetical protein
MRAVRAQAASANVNPALRRVAGRLIEDWDRAARCGSLGTPAVSADRERLGGAHGGAGRYNKKRKARNAFTLNDLRYSRGGTRTRDSGITSSPASPGEDASPSDEEEQRGTE